MGGCIDIDIITYECMWYVCGMMPMGIIRGKVQGITMTWSVSATLTGNTSSGELALDFFENYLGNITGWETTAVFDVSGSNAKCNARFDLTGRNDGTADYSYLHLGKSSSTGSILALSNSNGAADWTTAISVSTSSSYAGGFSGYTGGDVKLWISDQDTSSFMLTHSTMKILWLFLAPTLLDVPAVPFPANTVDTTSFAPAICGFTRDREEYPFLYGPPGNKLGTTANSSPRDVFSQFNYVGSNISYPSDSETLYQGFWLYMQDGSAGVGPVCYIDQNDVLANKETVSGAFNSLNSGITVTDGTNWWIRSTADLTAAAYWMSTGTVEPTL